MYIQKKKCNHKVNDGLLKKSKKKDTPSLVWTIPMNQILLLQKCRMTKTNSTSFFFANGNILIKAKEFGLISITDPDSDTLRRATKPS
jgi:hypothetical protein